MFLSEREKTICPRQKLAETNLRANPSSKRPPQEPFTCLASNNLLHPDPYPTICKFHISTQTKKKKQIRNTSFLVQRLTDTGYSCWLQLALTLLYLCPLFFHSAHMIVNLPIFFMKDLITISKCSIIFLKCLSFMLVLLVFLSVQPCRDMIKTHCEYKRRTDNRPDEFSECQCELVSVFPQEQLMIRQLLSFVMLHID